MRNGSRSSETKWVLALLLFASFATACGRQEGRDGSFASADAAAAALIEALAQDDVATAQRLLGKGSEALLSSGDAVQDKSDRANLVAAYGKAHELAAEGEDARTLVVGENGWSFPIPIVARGGSWSFDAEKGADELVYRRVGRNELGAIAVCRGFVEAQREYAAGGHDGDEPGVYALKLISDEGFENGLYWPTLEGEAPSPAGEFVAAAAADGYRRSAERTPYNGYYFRMLHAQGANANGGARDYFKDGVMTEGYALVAWPAEYESSGVMTFIVNQDGVAFQKDLGESTHETVETMETFDPDSSWTAVVESDA